MDNEKKTKRQLIEELNELRQQVAEFRRKEETFRESEESFRSLVEYSPTYIFMLDDAFRFIYGNKHFLDHLGCSEEDLKKMDFRDLIAPESMELVIDRYVRRQRGGRCPVPL